MKNKFLHLTDYTSLNATDTAESIKQWISGDYCGQVASYCVYSSLVDSVALTLNELKRDVSISAVCGGFPSAQTFLEVKMLDVAMAIENGADEIDIVANIGAIMQGDIELAMSEIRVVAQEIDGDALLKVILETGTIDDQQLIYSASLAAMAAGADFIKTSTGKSPIGATPEAVQTICRAIAQYKELTDRSIGIKISGGIRTDQQVQSYIDIVIKELGNEWITPSLLRFGRSLL